ncbi:MAG: prolipoprotein diacylglyceryl transferase [Desulfuromonadaceae bacterium]
MTYPQIDSVIIELGPFAVRWYGLMYLLGFVFAYFIIGHLARCRKLELSSTLLSDLLFYGVLGVVVGGRLGYTLFYNSAYYLAHPLEIFAIWEGGMSFHGGLLGVVVCVLYFCRRNQLPALTVGDMLVTAAPVGLGLGRLGNFINGELWGRVTTVSWGMVFPGGGPDPRHPSQLYEAVCEGPVLFVLLYGLFRLKLPPGVVFSAFFVGYGTIRFVLEFFRQPDAHLGLLWAGATMGQLLSVPMIIFGLIGLIYFQRKGFAA